MSLALNLLEFALILMFLVLVHEAGHMIVAKRCGMRVERFSIFFGRPIASFTRGETQYAIGWLPLGGYVKISGMTEDEEVPDEHAHRTYHRAATWRKVATIFAGPAVNILLAVAVFAVMFWVGVPTGQLTTTVAEVQVGAPADQIGLKPGDRIVAIDGVPADDPEQLRDLISSRPGERVSVTYERDGVSVTRETTLRSVEQDGRQIGRLGFGFGIERGPDQRFGPVGGITESLDFSWFVLSETARQLGRVVTDEQAREDVQSVVGVGAVYNEISGDGLSTILRFIGVLSLALAIFNLIPLPPLDGGHILFALIEKVRGSPLPRAVFERASMVGLALMLVLMVFVVQNDIIDISNGTVLGPR